MSGEASQITNGLMAQTYHNEGFMQMVGQIRAEQATIATNGGIMFVSLFIGLSVLTYVVVKVYERFTSKKDFDRDNVILGSLVVGILLSVVITLIYACSAYNALQVQYPEYYLLKSTVYDLWQIMG